MNANELRINNYIFCDRFKMRVISIDSPYVGLEDEAENCYKEIVDECYPIELNVDFLIYCGFKKQGKRNFYVKDSIGISVNKGFEIWIKDASNVFYRYALKIDYVHELQNLYFALTKNEIE